MQPLLKTTVRNARKALTVGLCAAVLGLSGTAANAELFHQADFPKIMDAPVTFSFEAAHYDCDAVLTDWATGATVSIYDAGCLSEYVLRPAIGMETQTEFGSLRAPDPAACETALVAVAVGSPVPMTATPCIATFMTPSGNTIAVEGVNGVTSPQFDG